MKSDGLSASSSSSSSIGIAGESSGSASGEEFEDGEVESKMRRDSLGSMDSLEDSLPVKRGLSEFFKEKSRSFASLSDVVTAPLTAGDLVKPENPFNKRRRILMAIRFRRASCGSLFPNGSQPQLNSSCSCSSANLFSLVEDEEKEEEEEEPKKGEESSTSPTSLGPLNSSCSASSLSSLSSSSSSSSSSLGVRNSKKVGFRSTRSFSLGDLQQHADQFTRIL